MPRAKRLPHEIAEGIEDVTAYLLRSKRPMRHALGLAATIRAHGVTPERVNLLLAALEELALTDESALSELRRLRGYGLKEKQ